MLHVGDITKLSGYTLPPVDVITGGSPCQGLSCAGLRKGLTDERSGLFLEQIRIVRELREEDKQRGRTGMLIRPRYMVWENVPGAFSSNKGRDFRRVLTECVRIAKPDAPDVPYPEKGKWTKAGLLVGDGWSLAWRVLDAQYWGVAQRRRRIVLVCDFGGRTAPEILFNAESVSGNAKTCGQAEKGDSGAAKKCAYPSVARTLSARYDGSPCIDRGPDIVVEAFPQIARTATTRNDRPGIETGSNIIVEAFGETGRGWWTHGVQTLRAEGENRPSRPSNIAVCYDARGNGDGKTVCTLTGDHANRVTDYTPLLCVGRARRFTPMEVERLQGYPDRYTDIGDWTDANGKTHKTSDSARYRALGNSIALPPWKWVLKRISAQYERDATLGSLFDGLGGFPLLWEQFNGKGSAVWASEIEPFCIAVTKRHF